MKGKTKMAKKMMRGGTVAKKKWLAAAWLKWLRRK